MKRLGYLSLLIVIVLLPGLLLINSCRHVGIPANEFKQICFTKEVLPIFTNGCGTTGCHDGNRGEQRYAYIDPKSIMASITPYNLKKSKAYQAMTSTFRLMPPGNALPIEKRTIIMLWIEQGADTTKCGPTVKTGSPVATSGKLLSLIKNTDLKVMPPAYALTKSEVSDFELLITQGNK